MKRKVLFIFWLMAALTFMYPLTSLHALDLSNIDDYLYPQESSKTISLDFKEANLNDVLKIFSQQSGLNFIASAKVAKEKISVYLEHVPVEEALERILSSKNLTYELKAGSNVFIVRKLTVPRINIITRVYHLKHATIPSSKLNSTLSEFDNQEGSDDADSGTQDAQGILGAVESVLTPNGSIIEDIRTNSLIVSDIPSQFPRIEQVIKRLDIRTVQILIEAELLDISKTTADLLGAKFGNSPVVFAGAQKNTLFPFDLSNDDIRNLGDGNEAFGLTQPTYTAGNLSFAGLGFTLQFLRTQTDTKSLARPRILTLNNETAEIQISKNEAIGLESNTTSSEGTASTILEAERTKTGVFLTVTPQANVQTGEIILALEPKVIQAIQSTGFDGSDNFKDTEERGTKSILRVQDGDTIMIGGLFRNDDTDVRTRVPILANIPLIGAAFRHKDKNVTQRELVIFITPHIVKDTLAFVSRSTPRISSIRREQDIPLRRLKKINQELSILERRR